MVEPRESRLLAWALGSFHASFFVLVVIIVLVSTGGIAGLLAGLNTLLGFALFVLLWAVSWWATRRGFRGFDFSSLDELDLGKLLGRAFVWGGVAGVLFLLGLAIVVLVNTRADVAAALSTLTSVTTTASTTRSTTSRDAQAAFVVIGVAVPIAAFVAYIIGALIGGILGMVDAIALIVARALIRLSKPITAADE